MCIRDRYCTVTGYGYTDVIGNIFGSLQEGIHYMGNRVSIKDNLMKDVTTKYVIDDTSSYCDEYVYTSLPSNTIVFKGRPILYYDGTNYYLAVWDGSTWRKVQLA